MMSINKSFMLYETVVLQKIGSNLLEWKLLDEIAHFWETITARMVIHMKVRKKLSGR